MHRGTVMCPPCEEICNDYFTRHNQTCRIRDEAPPNGYPKDELQCGAAASSPVAATGISFAVTALALVHQLRLSHR